MAINGFLGESGLKDLNEHLSGLAYLHGFVTFLS
jgi:hypothetical protein